MNTVTVTLTSAQAAALAEAAQMVVDDLDEDVQETLKTAIGILQEAL